MILTKLSVVNCIAARLCSVHDAVMLCKGQCSQLTGVLGLDLGVLRETDLPSGGVPLTDLGVRPPLLLALRLLTCLKTLQTL